MRFLLSINESQITFFYLTSNPLICQSQSILSFAVSVFLRSSLIITSASLQKASATFCESSDSFWTEYAWFSSSAFEAVQEQAFSNDWDEKTSSQNLQEWCWYYIAIDSLRKQLRDLYTQYQHWCAVYNQTWEDVNTQIRRIKSIDSALNMKRNAQVKKKTRYEADKQQMIIIVKFIDILHASRVLDENVRIWLKAEALKLNLLIAMKIVDASVMW